MDLSPPQRDFRGGGGPKRHVLCFCVAQRGEGVCMHLSQPTTVELAYIKALATGRVLGFALSLERVRATGEEACPNEVGGQFSRSAR